jgi:hypothetical protein
VHFIPKRISAAQTAPMSKLERAETRDLPDPLKADEIAALERVDCSTVFYWCRTGKLAGAYKLGGIWRIPRQAYLDFRKYPKPSPRTRAPSKRPAGVSREREADAVLDRAGV